MTKSRLHEKLFAYKKLNKGVLKKINLKPTDIALGAAFLMGMPVVDATIQYSGLINNNLSWNGYTGASYTFNTVNIDIDGGGYDIQLQGLQNTSGTGSTAFQIGLIGGNVNALNAFLNPMSYALPYAQTVNKVFGPGDAWQNKNTQFMSVVANPAKGYWDNVTNGDTRFVGFRLNGNNYGWIRIQKVDSKSWTVVDWAYEDSGAPISPSTTLAVELLNFTAIANGNTARLAWTTAMEEDNAGFYIQRSENGKDFKDIQFIEGHGTTTEKQEYYYDDKNLRYGRSYYYRLKAVEYSGSFEYSEVINLTLNARPTAVSEFYPNPVVNGTSQIDYTAQSSTTLSIDVYTTAGQLLRSETRDVAVGLNTLAIDFGDLPSGMVFVKIAEGGDAVYKKVMIR